jgi:hypothetical protein
MKAFSRLLFLLVFFSLACEVKAATLYFDPNETDISPGSSITVAIRLDTDENECINVIDGVLSYPENINLVDYSLGNSILPIWVQEPIIDKKNRRITFAGGIPNGYCGRIDGDPKLTNVILELVFQAPGFQIGVSDSDPMAVINFSPETKVLLNDGFGTPAKLTTLPANIFVHKQPTGSVVDEWKDIISNDKTPPNEFAITLNSDKSIFAGRYFIVFNTTDKQSGIAHYEVIEESMDDFNLFSWGAADAPWIKARSPYKLNDQSLNSVIRVRAYDKAGNQYVATLVPDESMRGLSVKDKFMTAIMFTGLIVFILIILVGLYYVKKRRRSTDETNDLI